MLFPLLQLYCTSKEPRNGVYEKQGKISLPEGTPSIGPFHVHFESMLACYSLIYLQDGGQDPFF